VSQSAPGWYQDHDDPRLARWWDGDRWTEHTLVLDEQDWSTEPDPPQTGTRFPTPSTGEVPVVEPVPEGGFEEDIYAPIRDPWGEEEVAADPVTTAWSEPDGVWGAGGTAAIAANPGWDDGGVDTSWADVGRTRPRGVQSWPTWAKAAVPIGVLVAVLLLLGVAGALDGGDDGTTTTSSTSTTQVNLGDAAQTALRAAGTGPFTLSTFTTLIPLTCDAAANNNPTNLTDRISLLGYDAATVGKLIDGLEAGTEQYCPDDMAKTPTLLPQVETAVLGGATTTSSSTSSTLGVTSTTKKTTATTKKPTTTTKPPVVTTATPTTQAPATTSSTAPGSTTTSSTIEVVEP
jgi:hypothetical protein